MTRRLQGRNNRKQDCRVRLLAFLAMTYVLFLLPTSNTPRLCEKDFSPTWQSLEFGACPRNRKAHATLMSLIQMLILQKQDVAGFLKNAFIAHRQGKATTDNSLTPPP